MSRDLPRPLLLLGLAGSVLVLLGGLSSGSLVRPAPGTWLGLEPLLGRTAGALVVAVGVVALGTAWWRARACLDGVAPQALIRAAALWSLPLLVAPPLFTRDPYAYAAQAAIVVRGLDPYVLGPDAAAGGVWSGQVDAVWRGTPSPYGPAFLAPAALALRVSGDRVELAQLLLRLLAVLGLVLAAWALPRLADRAGVAPQQALWLGLANPLLMLHGVAGMHNDVLMVGLVLAALALHRHLVVAGALVVLGALVKAPALAALPVLVLAVRSWPGRLRAAGLVTAGGGATALAVPVVTGLGWGWTGTLDAGRSLLSLFSPVTGLGSLLGTAAEALGLAGTTAGVRDPVLDAAAVLGVLVAGGLLLATPRLGPVRALGLALLAVVLLSPTVLPWYLLWGVLPLAAAVSRRTAVALGAACLVLALLTWPDGRSVVRPPLHGLPLVLAAGAAAVIWRTEAGTGRPAAKEHGWPRDSTQPGPPPDGRSSSGRPPPPC